MTTPLAQIVPESVSNSAQLPCNLTDLAKNSELPWRTMYPLAGGMETLLQPATNPAKRMHAVTEYATRDVFIASFKKHSMISKVSSANDQAESPGKKRREPRQRN
jgi:hypothetical protein